MSPTHSAIAPDGLLASVTVPIWLLFAHSAFTLLLLVVIWSLKHRRDPRFKIGSTASVPELMRSVAGLTHGHVIEGNAVEVIENGRLFDRLIEDIGSARHSVHFETYLWKDGALSDRLSIALAERGRGGVPVRVLVDANGGKDMGSRTEQLLRASECMVARYRPGRLRVIGRLNNRDHRKLAVIDGRVAYVGGHCVADNWLGDAEDSKHFRDISVRLRGPIVHEIQSTFSENWVATTGELFLGDAVFPSLEEQGDTAAHLARMRPAGAASDVKMLHHLVICCASKQVLIQNPYFLPDSEGIALFAEAVRRGVDVRVMTPASAVSDMRLVQHAAHHNYGRLLAAGVRILEYQKTLLHQKVMIVDGAWCAIGSSNFDERSFEINDEITLGINDASIAAEFEEIFHRDAEDCVELRVESWSRRRIGHRLVDRAFYTLKEQL